MENSEKNRDWFSSLIGFFYGHNIHYDTNIVNRDNSLKLVVRSVSDLSGYPHRYPDIRIVILVTDKFLRIYGYPRIHMNIT